MVQFKNFQAVILLLIIFSSLGPIAVVNGLRCYRCNYTTDQLGQSNPGCNDASPPDFFLGLHGVPPNETYYDAALLDENKITPFCFMNTIKSNENIFGIYRGEGSIQNYTTSGVNDKCLDLTQADNDHVQTYITDQTRGQWKNDTNYANGRCYNGKGTVVTHNITILGCYCTEDKCNGANFNASQAKIGNFNQPESVKVITYHTCTLPDPTTTKTETGTNSTAGGKEITGRAGSGSGGKETTGKTGNSSNTGGFGVKLVPLQSTYMFIIFGIWVIYY